MEQQIQPQPSSESTPASPDRLQRVSDLVTEVWGMRPGAPDTPAVPPTDSQYVGLSLSGAGWWELTHVRRDGKLFPAVVTQAVHSAVPVMRVLSGGTVWLQEGEGTLPVDEGARGAHTMTTILETLQIAMQYARGNCFVDGQQLSAEMASSAS